MSVAKELYKQKSEAFKGQANYSTNTLLDFAQAAANKDLVAFTSWLFDDLDKDIQHSLIEQYRGMPLDH